MHQSTQTYWAVENVVLSLAASQAWHFNTCHVRSYSLAYEDLDSPALLEASLLRRTWAWVELRHVYSNLGLWIRLTKLGQNLGIRNFFCFNFHGQWFQNLNFTYMYMRASAEKKDNSCLFISVLKRWLSSIPRVRVCNSHLVSLHSHLDRMA